MPKDIEKVRFVILAAGKGKRMQSEDPKALTLLKGKPFLKHILDTLNSLDENIRPVIVVGHKMDRVKEAIGQGEIYAEQKEQLGTGHAVLSAKEAIPGEYEALVVIYADQPMVSRDTLERLIATHLEKRPTLTLATVTVPDFEEWRAGLKNYGRILRDKEGKIIKIQEAKDATEEEKDVTELNVAFFVFDRKWLWENIAKLKNQNAQTEYYLTDLVMMACGQGERVEAVPVQNILEALQPNSKEELELLEKLVS